MYFSYILVLFCQGQKMALDLQGLELQAFVSYHVGARNQRVT